MKASRILIAILALVSSAAFAGTVQVQFLDPAHFTDAGVTPAEQQANMAVLARHLENLGQRWLAPNQQLNIVVTDVDLAGRPRPSRRTASGWIRVARADFDWPEVQLRYSLAVDGRPVASSEERIKDMDFAGNLYSTRSSEPLYFEQRMLSRWFRDRFAGGLQAYSR
jgi:hypothetical protein